MKSIIITIGRQFGSGGHELGEKLAKRLGIPFYDRNLLSKAAVRCGMTEDMVESLDEVPTSSFLYSIAVGAHGFGGEASLPLGNRVFLAMSEAIREVAGEGSCVIVGRCAEYVLAEREDVLSVFVYGDKDARVQRVMAKRGLKERDAAALMQRTDKKRAGYHDFYCESKWGSPEGYDVMINSTSTGIDAAVEMLATLAEKM
ncbi:MAG: cytidylate kinase-like family protein [Clostridia bacterium]|nr:cytidylate kinase-like family protein [Clostridia bacterium]